MRRRIISLLVDATPEVPEFSSLLPAAAVRCCTLRCILCVSASVNVVLGSRWWQPSPNLQALLATCWVPGDL